MRKTKKRSAKPAAKPAEVAQSDANWETFTPPVPRADAICLYGLEMYVDTKGVAAEEGQRIEITRDELIELKGHLRRMRTDPGFKFLDHVKCVHYRCNRFDIGADGGPTDDPTFLVNTDGDGDWIYSSIESAMLPGMNPVLVLFEAATTKEDAVRMLRKVTDSIEQHGIQKKCCPTRTEHPFLAKHPDAAANLRKSW